MATMMASPPCGSVRIQASRFRLGNSRTGLVASARCGIGGHELQTSIFSMPAKIPFRRQAFLAACMSTPGGWNWTRCCFSKGSLTSLLTDPTEELEVEDATEVERVAEQRSPLTPSPGEIQSFLMEVCDETSIAEVSLEVGAFKLHFKRAVGKAKEGPAPAVTARPSETPIASSPPATTKPKSTSSSTSVTTTSLTSVDSIIHVFEQAVNEGLSFVKSPKVGYFRKGRVVKGKLGKPLCEEGHVVREGQVVCYLEQLGTQQPVETEVTGEVVKILWNDEDPVGYGDPLIAIRPSFPGIKKLT